MAVLTVGHFESVRFLKTPQQKIVLLPVLRRAAEGGVVAPVLRSTQEHSGALGAPEHQAPKRFRALPGTPEHVGAREPPPPLPQPSGAPGGKRILLTPRGEGEDLSGDLAANASPIEESIA
ncbi:hypothetical protein BDV93DRAFT_513344 [Ceratobasidium sp. AG-I]|nr:hypothetical protein BDV93DRAFT_513344 [Ceratobasidium sp. AG-I]